MVDLPETRLAEITARVAAADAADRHMQSACGEYHCDCHADVPALVAEIRRLRGAAADEAEPADTDWLESRGFKWSADGESVYYGTAGPQVVCGVETNTRADTYLLATSLSLHWLVTTHPTRVSGHYGIRDNPTRGDVDRLIAALDPK